MIRLRIPRRTMSLRVWVILWVPGAVVAGLPAWADTGDSFYMAQGAVLFTIVWAAWGTRCGVWRRR